jgi:hypothetical protein
VFEQAMACMHSKQANGAARKRHAPPLALSRRPAPWRRSSTPAAFALTLGVCAQMTV